MTGEGLRAGGRYSAYEPACVPVLQAAARAVAGDLDVSRGCRLAGRGDGPRGTDVWEFWTTAGHKVAAFTGPGLFLVIQEGRPDEERPPPLGDYLSASEG